MRTTATIAAVVVAGLMMASIASAAPFVVQPVTATTTSEDPSWAGIWNAYSGNGMGGDDWPRVRTGQPVPNPWPGHSTGNGVNYQTLSGQKTPTVIFDLGDTYSLTGMHFWNASYWGLNNWGVRTANVSVSTDGANYTPVSLGGLGAGGTFFQTTVYSYSENLGVDYTFSAAARYVRMDITSNWGGSNTSISEVRFVAVPAVPGDANRDSIVDQADYTIWYNNYGSTGGSVPEPTSLSLLAMCGLAMLRCGCNRK